MTNAEARYNKSLRPRKPEGSLGRTAQDVHLDSHTAPELWHVSKCTFLFIEFVLSVKSVGSSRFTGFASVKRVQIKLLTGVHSSTPP